MFTTKTPNEALLRELFSRLKQELAEIKREGIVIRDNLDVEWRCMPISKNAMIVFAALKILFISPRWMSRQGCHLCSYPDGRIGRRNCWFVRFQNRADRRTNENIISDAALQQNGLAGNSRMMDLLTMEMCRPDALHMLSAGVSVDFMTGAFFILLLAELGILYRPS
ncbi:hypothetical protein Aduo_005881 [Ancylostoma duodenale]